MQTHVSCPRCGTAFVAEVHQLLDVGQQPELKQLLLSGQFNVAACPACGTAFPVVTPLMYHDPAHELFMVHVPMELNLPQVEREQLIGRLIQRVMNNLPPEDRRAYLLQPETVLTMQTFMEKVLATEGITREMIERQRQQAELLETLATADRDVVDVLLQERAEEIDETFFALLAAHIEALGAGGDDRRAVRLLNLQARLFEESPVGRQIEKRQTTLRQMQKEAKKEGGLSPRLLLKYVLAHRHDEPTLEAIVTMGQGALSYEFFALLSDEIDKKRKLGGETAAQSLVKLREELLAIYETLQEQSQAIMNKAGATLRALMEAKDPAAAVRERLEEIDDPFMYVLSATMAQFEEKGDKTQARRLRQIYDLILGEMERQAPPEVRLINQLMRARDESEQRRLLGENPAQVNPQLVRMLSALAEEAEAAGQQELVDHVRSLVRLVEASLALSRS